MSICDYTNADIKTVKKHIKRVEKLNKQKKKSLKKQIKKPQKKDNYKNYMLLFAHIVALIPLEE
ncbi:hypothetical protein ACPB8Q_02785 [Methanocaldococcus indicus]|uniref:hypothetical protein n=1 Tax=Methanocaldococcus indicus TaxID=213231 RepID=UPI003C6CE4E3